MTSPIASTILPPVVSRPVDGAVKTRIIPISTNGNVQALEDEIV